MIYFYPRPKLISKIKFLQADDAQKMSNDASSFYAVHLSKLADPDNLTDPEQHILQPQNTVTALRTLSLVRNMKTKLNKPKRRAKSAIQPLEMESVLVQPSPDATKRHCPAKDKLIADDAPIVSSEEENEEEEYESSQLTPFPSLSILKAVYNADLARMKPVALKLSLEELKALNEYMTHTTLAFADDILHEALAQQKTQEAVLKVTEALQTVSKDLATCFQCRRAISVINQLFVETGAKLRFKCTQNHRFCNACTYLFINDTKCPFCSKE